MATEETVFDKYLKENLWKDLLFRAVFWVAISALGFYNSPAISNLVFRVANIMGTAAIFLGLVALMFKDLEQLSPQRWGRGSILGRVGGVFRRLAGDITLWTLGTLVSTLFIVGLFGFRSTGSLSDWALFTFLYFLLAAMCSIVAVLNVYVRRIEPPFATKFKMHVGC
jgi:hypothetical protein